MSGTQFSKLLQSLAQELAGASDGLAGAASQTTWPSGVMTRGAGRSSGGRVAIQ